MMEKKKKTNKQTTVLLYNACKKYKLNLFAVSEIIRTKSQKIS